MHNTEAIVKDMLRVGREAIVTFPNFGYWRSRWQIAVGAELPLRHHALALAEEVGQRAAVADRDRLGGIGDAEMHRHPGGLALAQRLQAPVPAQPGLILR